MDNLNFENKRGVEQEINYLGSINNRKYVENVEKKLTDFLAINYLIENKSCKDPKSFLVWLKNEKKEMFERLTREIDLKLREIMDKRVVKNRHIFLREINENDQFEIIEKSQANGFDPCDPKTDFANDLHATIVEEMSGEYSDLEYYSAGGSHLDYCGVDAFFKFKYLNDHGEEDFVRVCLDLTSNTLENKNINKTEKIKNGGKSLTDLVLFIEDEEYNKKKHEKKIKDFSKQIIEIIGTKIDEKKKEKKVSTQKNFYT